MPDSRQQVVHNHLRKLLSLLRAESADFPTENRMPGYGAKSNSSSDSEEVLVRRGSRPGSSKAQTYTKLKQPDTPTHPTRRGMKSPMDVSRTSLASPVSNLQHTKGETSKDAMAGHNPSAQNAAQKQKKPVVALKANPYAPAPPEVLEELKRLQEPMLKKAHQDRLKDVGYPTASPELLVQARDGPGTDPNSEIFKKIEKIRQVTVTASTKESVPSSSSAFSIFKQDHGAQRHRAQWTVYKGTPRVYPSVDNGKVVLSTTPAPGQEYDEAAPTIQPGLEKKQQIGHDHAPENKWADAFAADWEYRPKMCSNYAAFRDWFRVWLDTTIMNSCVADIYHESFFDGTAHPDGSGSLFIGDFEHEPTSLDLEDDETRLHHHETVAGYAHNFEIHIKKQEEEEEAHKQRARAAYIESMSKAAASPSPYVPRANIYLRPAELGDALELSNLMNWYMENSPLSTDDVIVSQEEVHRRIQNCRAQYFPFIVAVERRTSRTHNDATSAPEKILGYALANDFIDRNSSGRYTANLQLFVRHGSKGKGIGRCLMHKLLEVCDAMFKSKGGYYFDNGSEDHMGYYPGGGRRLSRLIFAISYPDNDRASYEWVINWLKGYEFEEQGVLKGVAVKFQRQ
jgi:L-amino acid N-acyltransferase YncA